MATEVNFYHLTKSSLEDALPRLLVKTLQAGERAVVMLGSAERVDALNTYLWAYDQDSFLPHGSARDGEADRQPVWLTHLDENPNGAAFLFVADRARSERPRRLQALLRAVRRPRRYGGRRQPRALEGLQGGRPHACLLATDRHGRVGKEGVGGRTRPRKPREALSGFQGNCTSRQPYASPKRVGAKYFSFRHLEAEREARSGEEPSRHLKDSCRNSRLLRAESIRETFARAAGSRVASSARWHRVRLRVLRRDQLGRCCSTRICSSAAAPVSLERLTAAEIGCDADIAGATIWAGREVRERPA